MNFSKRFIFIGFSLLISIFIYGTSEGATWKFFSKGKTSSYYYFPGTMKIASSGIVSVWVRSIPQSESQIQEILEERLGTGLPLKKDLKNFGYSHSYIKLHCKDRKMRVVQEKIFNKDGFLLSSYFVPPHWKNLNQDFFPSKLSSIVCPKKYAKR